MRTVVVFGAGLLLGCGGVGGVDGNQRPVIDHVDPSRVTAQSVRVTPNVYGAAFAPGATARVDGAERPINFVDPSWVQVILENSDLAEPGTVEIEIDNGDAGGRSNAVRLSVVNEAATIFSISPTEVLVGGPTFPDTVFGRGFLSSTVIRVNGQDRPTKVVDNASAVVQIPASDVARTGLLRLVAFTPAPLGGTSNEMVLPVLVNHQITSSQTLSIRGEAVIADPVRPLLYLAVVAQDQASPGSVAVIDPATGNVVRSFSVAPGPGALAVSAGGQYLYVASRGAPRVDRIDLASGAVLAISLQVGAPDDQPRALDMVPLNGSPGSVLMTLDRSAAPGTPGLIVFDGAVPRPRPVADLSMSRIEPGAAPNVAYGFVGTTFFRFAIGPDGVRLATDIPALTEVSMSDVQQVEGKVYASNGGIYDLEVGRVAGTFSRGTGTFFVDAARGRVFLVQGNEFKIWAVSLATGNSLGTVFVSNAGDGLRGNITSFGADGLALFTTDQRLILIRSTLVTQ